MASEAKSSAPLSLIFIDLDHFKSVNDTFDHLVGDDVLIETAVAIRAVCTGKGRCYRWGGEEFAALLPNYTLAEAQVLAERVREMISQTQFKSYPHTITASIGAATLPETSSHADLVKNADNAMQEAKNSGRNRVCSTARASDTGLESEVSKSRLSATEISKRVDAARILATIASGIAANFLIQVRNDSNDEIKVKEVQLLSKDNIHLTQPARPPSENSWRILPSCTLPISWRADPNPAASLVNMNSHRGALFETDLKIGFTIDIFGKTKLCECRFWVRVDAYQMKIIQLAGG